MTSSIFSLGNAIRAVLLIGLFGVSFVLVQSCQPPKTALDAYAQDSVKKVRARTAPPSQPSTVFETADGRELSLKDLRGKVILVNLWGTWCAPCIKEMPSLDRLQALRGGESFEVVTIAVERTPHEPAKFFADNDIENLIPWHDGTHGIPGNLRLLGFPSTVIYNADGREIAFLEGDAEWDSPEALRLIDYLISQ